MATAETAVDGGARRLLPAALALPGIALAGYGGYTHLSIAAQVASGRCDGCAPWHPLFVVAPLVVGLALLLGAVALVARRR